MNNGIILDIARANRLAALSHRREAAKPQMFRSVRGRV